MIRKILQTLERYVQTDVRYLIKGSGTMLIGQVLVTLVALATSTAFANLLSKEAYGTYQYILTAAEFLTIFSLVGIGRATITSVARGNDGALDDGFKKGMLWGTGAIALGVAVGVYYFIKGNTLFALGIGVGTFLTLVISTSKIYISFLSGRKLFFLTSSFIVIGILVPGIATVTALLLTQNLTIILATFLLSSASTNLSLFLWSRRYARNTKTDPHMIREALHLSADAMIGRVVSYVDRLLLFQFAGPAILAEFWIAQNVERQFSHLFKSANSVVLPKLSSRTYTQLQQSLPRKIALLYALIIPFTIGYVIVTPYIFLILFPQYVSATIYAQVFGLLFFFLPIKPILDVFIGHKMHHVLYRITLASSLSKLAATVSLVPFLGIWGVIISTFVDQIVYTVIVLWYFFRNKPSTVDESH